MGKKHSPNKGVVNSARRMGGGNNVYSSLPPMGPVARESSESKQKKMYWGGYGKEGEKSRLGNNRDNSLTDLKVNGQNSA